MTTVVTADFVLAAGQTLTTVDEGALQVSGGAWRDVTLNGRLVATAPTYPYPLIAIRAYGDSTGSTTSQVVTIGATGFVSVETTSGAYAVAFAPASSLDRGVKLVNLGVIDVRSSFEAQGVSAAGGGIDNRGTITVNAIRSASGVGSEFGGSFANSGTITVTGGSGQFQGAVGVQFVGVEAATFTNSGTITVSHLAAPSLAVGVAISGYTNFVNSGTISADKAIALSRDGILSGNGRHSTITNSGTLRGEVFLNNTAAEPVRLRNSGLIEGNVTLNTGNDTYDGVGGGVSGTVRGEAGADSIIGGTGAETLSGDAGNDTIDGGTGGADVLDGGDGIDTLSFAGAAAGIILDVSGQTAPLVTFRGFEQYIGSEHADRIAGSAAADTLGGGGGADTVYGGASNDSITDTSGANYLRGDEGDDRITGGADFDDINGNTGNDTASGGDGEDWVVGGKDNDGLSGDAAYDLVYGNLGNDTCDGGAGNDIVRGGQDDDLCLGGGGDDFVSGDRGADTMTGGTGADVFHTFGDAGLDRVTDFSLAQGDRVQVDPGTQYTVSQSGADTVINMTGGGQMILVGVQMSSLTAGWIFGA